MPIEQKLRMPDLSPNSRMEQFDIMADLVRQRDFALNYEHHVASASEKLRTEIEAKWPDMSHPPSLVITRGSGMERLSEIMDIKAEIHARDLHGALVSIVPGHDDRITVGSLNGAVVMIVPRLHGQENADKLSPHLYPRMIPDICANICMLPDGPRVLYLATHAAGGVDLRLHKGDIVIPDTHSIWKYPMHLLGEVGQVLDFGKQVKGRRGDDIFVSMTAKNGAYPIDAVRQLAELAERYYSGRVHSKYVNAEHGDSIEAHWLGRIYQARGDILEARRAGITTIGQSPLPEIVAWLARGGDVLALTVVTNVTTETGENPVDHRHVKQTAGQDEIQTALSRTFTDFAAFAEERYMAQIA